MKTQSNISRTLSIFFAIILALFMATACGNIAGTSLNSTNATVAAAPAPDNGQLPSVQPQGNTLNATTFGTGAQPQIIVDKPN